VGQVHVPPLASGVSPAMAPVEDSPDLRITEPD
jgi:hypothetical protein